MPKTTVKNNNKQTLSALCAIVRIGEKYSYDKKLTPIRQDITERAL